MNEFVYSDDARNPDGYDQLLAVSRDENTSPKAASRQLSHPDTDRCRDGECSFDGRELTLNVILDLEDALVRELIGFEYHDIDLAFRACADGVWFYASFNSCPWCVCRVDIDPVCMGSECPVILSASLDVGDCIEKSRTAELPLSLSDALRSACRTAPPDGLPDGSCMPVDQLIDEADYTCTIEYSPTAYGCDEEDEDDE